VVNSIGWQYTFGHGLEQGRCLAKALVGRYYVLPMSYPEQQGAVTPDLWPGDIDVGQEQAAQADAERFCGLSVALAASPSNDFINEA